MNQRIRERIDQINKGEIPAGYKKTKAGICPVEWDIVKLSDICEKRMQKNNDKTIKSVFTNSAQYGIIDQEEFFKKEIANNDNIGGYNIVNENDFVYNPRISSMAPCGPININSLNRAGVVSPLYTVFYKKENRFSIKYLTNLLTSTFWHNYARSIANYGARSDRMNITDKEFFNMPICSPPPQEQQKIAEILSVWDKAIEAQEQLINKLEIRKKALMQKLLIPKEGWEKVKIGDLGSIITGNTPPTSKVEYYNGDILWVTPTDISNKYTEEVERYLTPKGAKVARILPKGSILITCIASIGKNTILKKEGSCNQQINAVIVNHLYDNEFIYYLLELFSKRMVLLAGKSATPIISKGLFEKMKIYIPYKDRQPDLKEQNRIANILSLADKEIELHKQQLEQLTKQRKSMMQLLLTGIVRTVDNGQWTMDN